MRTAIILPILLLAACSVSRDPNNNAVTLGYDNGAVENGTKAVTTEAGKIAGDIANDVKDTGSKIETKISEHTAAGTADNTAANASDNTSEKAPAKKH
ncbi:MAG: hypothetical protein ABI422_06760 [Sphingomicrobium sp.]